MPTASVDVVSAADAPDSATVPSDEAPSKNCTVPVGVVAPDTVAVNVTDCPNTEGFSDELRAVVVPTAAGHCENSDVSLVTGSVAVAVITDWPGGTAKVTGPMFAMPLPFVATLTLPMNV